MKKPYPIPRSRQYDVGASHELNIEGQGSIPYPQPMEVATPKVSNLSTPLFTARGEPSGKMEVRGRGAMLRGTSFTIR